MEDAGPNLHELAQWARDRLADDSGADVGSALGRRRIDGPSSGTFQWRAFIQDAQQHPQDDQFSGPVYGWRVIRGGKDEHGDQPDELEAEVGAAPEAEQLDEPDPSVPFADFGARAQPSRIAPTYMAPSSFEYDWSDSKVRPGGKAYVPMPTGWRNLLEGHGANLPRLALAGGAVFACAVTGFASTSALLNPESSEAADSGTISFEDAADFASVDIPTPLTAEAQTFAQSTLADQGASGRSIGDDAALESLAREQAAARADAQARPTRASAPVAAAVIPAPRAARIEPQRVEPQRVELRRVEPQRNQARRQMANRAPERAAPAALERRVVVSEQRVAAQPQRVAAPQRFAAAERVAAPERVVAPEPVAAPAPRDSNENMFVAASLMGDDSSVVEAAAPAAPVARRLDMASVSTNYGAPTPIAASAERPVSFTAAAAPVASAPRAAATAQASVRAPAQQQQHAGLWDGARRAGSGAAEDEAGRRYEGAWRDYKPHGRGTLTFSNGVQYEGEFANGEPTGRGTYSNAQGEPLHGGDLFNALLNNS